MPKNPFSQYRLTIEDATRPITDTPPSEWETPWNEIALAVEARGINAQLESRTVYPEADDLLVACFAEEDGSLPKGFIRIGKMLITPWRYEAASINR